MANFNYVVSTGVVIPDTSQLRDEVEAEWRAAFGNDMPLTPETPQGVMITAEVEARDGMVRNNAELANQINPDIAGGVWLDALWALTRGSRRGATRSVINGVIATGVPGTIIPAGSIASVASSQDQFRTTEMAVIGQSGSITMQMESAETGPIPAPIGSLSEVASSVLGWETVTNPSAAILGRSRESDVASRTRRRNTLALQGVAIPEAIISRVYNVDGVRSLSFRENYTSAPIMIDNIALAPHSIYVCVDGGSDADVGRALLASKTIGAGFNGSVLVKVLEPISGQEYEVHFDRPIPRVFRARVTVKPSTLDVQAIVPDAISRYTSGEMSGEPGLVVGANLSPFELSGAVNQVEPRIFISRVEISEDGVNWSSAEVSILINQIAILPKSAIQVVVS